MTKTSSIPKATSVSVDDKILGVSDGKPALIPISSVDFKPDSASEEEIKEAVLALHPVDSYYWSSKPTNPGTLFGGTWEAVTDGRLLRSDGKPGTNTGGSASVSISNIPSHSHTISSHTHSSASHGHTTGGHSHSISHGHSTDAHAHQNVKVYVGTAATSNIRNDTTQTQNCPVTIRESNTYSLSSGTAASATISTSNGGSVTSSNATPTVSIGSVSSDYTGYNSDSTGYTGSSSVSISLTPAVQEAYCWIRRQ